MNGRMGAKAFFLLLLLIVIILLQLLSRNQLGRFSQRLDSLEKIISQCLPLIRRRLRMEQSLAPSAVLFPGFGETFS